MENEIEMGISCRRYKDRNFNGSMKRDSNTYSFNLISSIGAGMNDFGKKELRLTFSHDIDIQSIIDIGNYICGLLGTTYHYVKDLEELGELIKISYDFLQDETAKDIAANYIEEFKE